jgi:LytS/YehU family sensor histidine kinase
MTEKQIYTYYRSKIKSEKSKKFLETNKFIYKNLELHHICGSNSGMKMTDYLIIPLTSEAHLEAHKNMPKSFCYYFDKSVEILMKYAKFELGMNIDKIPHDAETKLYCVNKVCDLINKIYNEENI